MITDECWIWRVSDEDPLRSAKFSMTLTIAPQLPLRQGYLKLGINTVTINQKIEKERENLRFFRKKLPVFTDTISQSLYFTYIKHLPHTSRFKMKFYLVKKPSFIQNRVFKPFTSFL